MLLVNFGGIAGECMTTASVVDKANANANANANATDNDDEDCDKTGSNIDNGNDTGKISASGD